MWSVWPIVSIGLVALAGGCATSDFRQSESYRRTMAALPTAVAAAKAPGRFSAGAARVEITPPVGMPLQGFGSRMGAESTGVHDPLYARALVLQQDDLRLALVSCDLMGVTSELYEAVLGKVRARLPLKRRQLVLFATHTHSGAGGLSDRFVMRLVGGRFRLKLFAEVSDKIAAAVVEAAQRAEPATLAIGSAEVPGINKNRGNPHGAVDRELKVLSIRTGEGRPLAWLVNFAAHPTVFGANREFSADYPGYLAAELEREGAICLFANGAAGDLHIGKRHDDTSKETRAVRAGRTLAAEARAVVEAVDRREQMTLEVRHVRAHLPPAQVRLGDDPHRRLPSWWGNRLFPRRASLHLVRLDRRLLLAVPWELKAETGLAWKRKAQERGFDLFLIGYANDYLGYLVPEATYWTRSYEARTSFYGPKLAEYVEEIVFRMMDSIQP